MDPFDLRRWPGFYLAGGSLSEPAIVDQISIDSRRIHSSHALFVALKGAKQDGHQYVHQAFQAGARYALVCHDWQPEKGLETSITLLRVSNPLKAFQEIAKAYRLQLSTKIIGVTGSFGKTMVKDLLHVLLGTEKNVAASPESFNSQIGVPLSLLTIRQGHEVAIIEAAISQKQEMETLTDLIRPDYTLLTPLGKKHLVTLESVATIAQETMHLILSTPATGWSLLPHHSLLSPYYPQIKSPWYFWDAEEENLPHASLMDHPYSTPLPYLLRFPDQTEYRGCITTGYAYCLNLINMAIKAAWLLGISSFHIQKVLSEYWPEPMRTEIWKSPLGALFINDIYGSDPQSIDLSLTYFEQASPKHRKTFVFGGMREHTSHLEADYRRIGKALSKIALDRLILFGPKPFYPLINELEKMAAPKPEMLVCDTYAAALQALASTLQSHDYILIKGDKKTSFDALSEIFNDSLNNNQCLINLAAIQTNILSLRKKLPPATRLMVMVKAQAYGTDDTLMAKYLAKWGIDLLGVSYVDEAIALKRAGVKQSIFSINAAPYEAAKVIKWNLEVGVSDEELIRALSYESQKQGKQTKVHLHINTGMSRLGCRPEEALGLARLIKEDSHLYLEGIMTHFACAEDMREDEFTHRQIQCFDETIAHLKAHGITAPWTHAANSSGAIRFHLPQYNMVRVGLAIYGLYGSEAIKEDLDLRLALSLTSRIVGINICKKGETVSYGRRYKVEKELQKIAVLPIGYFDGLHRHYSGKGNVWIKGYKAPMVGSICMDYMMVDVTDIPGVALGDKVLIFGEDEFGQYASPEDLAFQGGSIIHELVTCLGPRIQRIFIHEESNQIR